MKRCLLVVLIIFSPSPAFALRSFVTTDADVAEPYEIELEWGLFGLTLEKQPDPKQGSSV